MFELRVIILLSFDFENIHKKKMRNLHEIRICPLHIFITCTYIVYRKTFSSHSKLNNTKPSEWYNQLLRNRKMKGKGNFFFSCPQKAVPCNVHLQMQRHQLVTIGPTMGERHYLRLKLWQMTLNGTLFCTEFFFFVKFSHAQNFQTTWTLKRSRLWMEWKWITKPMSEKRKDCSIILRINIEDC